MPLQTCPNCQYWFLYTYMYTHSTWGQLPATAHGDATCQGPHRVYGEKKDGLFLWGGVPCMSIFTSSITQVRTETPLQSQKHKTHVSKKTHTTEVMCEESEAVEEYSRKRAAMTLHSPDPLTLPSLHCQLSTGYEPNPVPCSCGPKMPDRQNNAHRETQTPKHTHIHI